jgi:hypothetical protein
MLYDVRNRPRGRGRCSEPRVFPNQLRVLLTSDQNAQARHRRKERTGWSLLNYTIMDHFPTNWGRPVSMKLQISQLIAKLIVFDRNMTLLTPTQRIPSITVVMHSR